MCTHVLMGMASMLGPTQVRPSAWCPAQHTPPGVPTPKPQDCLKWQECCWFSSPRAQREANGALSLGRVGTASAPSLVCGEGLQTELRGYRVRKSPSRDEWKSSGLRETCLQVRGPGLSACLCVTPGTYFTLGFKCSPWKTRENQS